jgi:hypothetical protein
MASSTDTTTTAAGGATASDDDEKMSLQQLSFPFRGRQVPVTYQAAAVPVEHARLAVTSTIFQTWYRNCEKSQGDKRIEIHGVEIQSVDLFGTR